VRTLLLYTIFIFVGVLGFSQEVNDSVVRIDSISNLTDRSIPNGLTKKYIGEEFNYEVKTGESQNLLLRFLNWIGQGLQRVFGIDISPQTLQILEFLIYVAMAILVIYLLVRLFTNENFNSLFTKKAKILTDVNLSEEHIEAIDLKILLEKALEQNDFRLAVRYQFLLVLQLLSKKEIIDWHFEKTNSDYLNEIKKPSSRESFKKVSYLYEHIWYGEQPIDSQSYEKVSQDFESLHKTLIP